MTLDEQIEWLQLKIRDSYKLANACLNNDNMESCCVFSGDIYRYQTVIDSLKILKKLTESPTCEEVKSNAK